MMDKPENKNEALEQKHVKNLMQTAKEFFSKGEYALAIKYYNHIITHKQEASLIELTYAFYLRGCAYKYIDNLEKAQEDWLVANDLLEGWDSNSL